MENARLLTEQREALERQTATAEILAVINANPGNLAPVFEAMLEKAMTLCGVDFGLLDLLDGAKNRNAAARGLPGRLAAWLAANPERQLAPLGLRMAETRRSQKHLDVRDGEGYRNGHPIPRALVDLGGARSNLLVPLVKDDEVAGYFNVFRQEVRAFTDKETALLENFAAQAVIAMENARLLSELRVRDEDNRRLIARQAASIEILRTISENPDDPQPVFETIVRQAQSLCGGTVASVAEFDGELLHMRAIAGADAETRERVMGQYPTPPRPELLVGRVVLTGEAIHISDTQTDPRMSAFNQTIASQNDFRTSLTLPLLREGRPVGGMAMTRREAGGFTDDEVAMLQSFAEQAVIAIAGARAQRELRVRDEDNRRLIARQSASIDILKAISASPDDPQPVFDAIVGHALALCDCAQGRVAEFDGTLIHMRAMLGMAGDTEAILRTWPRPPGLETMHGRVVLAGGTVQIRDVAADATMSARNRELAQQIGYQSMLGVPLLRDGRVIGSFSMARAAAGGFSADDIALVESFAEQAVIAISGAAALGSLRVRDADNRRLIARQSASIEVL